MKFQSSPVIFSSTASPGGSVVGHPPPLFPQHLFQADNQLAAMSGHAQQVAGEVGIMSAYRQRGIYSPASPSTSNSSPSAIFKGEVCVGCSSDSAIRAHYGASSCHGCKAFFRRSVFEGRSYVCSAENNCNITNESRNKCRACRLRNCLEGGMNTKHVRDERSKQERRTPPDNSDPKTNKKSSHSVIREECQLTHFVCGLERQTELLTDDDVMGDDAGEWSRDVSLTSGLPNPRLVMKRSPVNWQCERIMQSADVYSSWYRAFVLHADWAMGIPAFRAIPLEDQTTLFKQNFMCFGWITHAYNAYILGHHEMGIPLGTGAYIPYPHEEQQQMEPKWASTYGIVSKKLIELIVKPMREMQMTYEEYCILKTISLFQQDCTLSATAQSICTRFTERLLEALLVHYERQFPSMSPTQRTMRALKLTLLLPSFNHIGQVESTMIQSMSAVDLNELSGVPIKVVNTHSSANRVLAIPTETLAACQ